MIIDFTKYQDGTSTTTGDVVYLTNTLKMPTGRMWSNSTRFSPDPNYKIPMIKFVIGQLPEVKYNDPEMRGQERDPAVDDAGAAAGSFELEGPA